MSHITVSTTQFEISGEPVTEQAPASYKVLNGSVYISYETADGSSDSQTAGPEDITDNREKTAGHDINNVAQTRTSDRMLSRTIIKLTEKSLEVRREGGVRGRLIYASGETTVSQLDLGFSVLEIKNVTHSISMIETDDTLAVTVRYDLHINGGFVSECRTEILLEK